MLKAEPLPPDASIASTGKDIRYLGNHVYGLSGSFAFTDSAAYGLEFTSGSGYIKAAIYFGYHNPSGDNIETHVLFNNILVFNAESNSSYSGDFQNGFANLRIIIPPFTKVQVGAINVSGATERDGTLVLSGRIYGVKD